MFVLPEANNLHINPRPLYTLADLIFFVALEDVFETLVKSWDELAQLFPTRLIDSPNKETHLNCVFCSTEVWFPNMKNNQNLKSKHPFQGLLYDRHKDHI